MPQPEPPLLLLGVGPVALQVAGTVRDCRKIYGTTRNPERIFELYSAGIEPIIMPWPSAEIIASLARGSHVLVSFPPDGSADSTLAPACKEARQVVYISSTRVYGSNEGPINERTPVAAIEPQAQPRLEAEAAWRNIGATILRAAGIYGPHSSLLKKLQEGTYKITPDSHRVISRIHIDDLAAIILNTFRQKSAGKTYVVADLCPSTQLEVIEWLCQHLSLPLPTSSAEEPRSSQLKQRLVDPEKILADLGIMLSYPTYKEGYMACLKSLSLDNQDNGAN